MTRLKNSYYTLVRHSAFYKEDPRFDKAVEAKQLTTTAELVQVAQADGLIYNSYKEAESAEAAANYPPEVEGIVPQARGTFSAVALDGMHIYVRERAK